MRVMGLDYGSKTVGVALSDELLMTAQPKETIWRDREGKIRKTLVRIEELILEYDVRLIVLGLPLNMDDSIGERAEAALDFKERLERRTSVPVVMSDERLTTVEADEMLSRMEIPPQHRKQYLDQIAASVILQEYMENHRKELEQIGGKEEYNESSKAHRPETEDYSARRPGADRNEHHCLRIRRQYYCGGLRSGIP